MTRFRLGPIVLALAGLLGSPWPAAAIDLTNFTPFADNFACHISSISSAATICQGSVSLPDKETVLEYISFSCSGIPVGGRVVAVSFESNVNGVANTQFLELPVAASLGGVSQTSGGQVVRLYADPDSSIALFATINASSSSFLCTFHLSGEQSPLVP